jgi:hypothetical protein
LRALAQPGHRIRLRPGDEEERAEALASRQRLHKQLEAEGEREGLVRLLAAEGHELFLPGLAEKHVAPGDLAHRDVGDQRVSVRARDADRERVRPGQGGPTPRRGESRRRRRRERGREPTLGQPPHPVAEHAGGEAVRGGDDTRMLGWIGELCLHDPAEDEVAEGASTLPALETGLGDRPQRLGRGVEVRKRSEPVDAHDAVARPAAAVSILEVVGEERGVRLAEPETAKPLEGFPLGQAETSGSDLTMPTPCSRFVSEIVCARETIARETSVSGSASTIGSPSSA